MGRSQETYNKKEVRDKKAKKRLEKEKKRLARKDRETKGGLDDMIAYVDENGMLTSTPPDPNKKKKEIKAENIAISIPKHDDSVVYEVVRKGIVTFFNDSKGYGFIKDSETKESVFVHVNNVIDEIKENNVVNYEVEMGQKGPTAVKVKLFKEVKQVKQPKVKDVKKVEAVKDVKKVEETKDVQKVEAVKEDVK